MSRTSLSTPRKPIDPIKKIVSGIHAESTSGYMAWSGTAEMPSTVVTTISFWIKLHETLPGSIRILQSDDSRYYFEVQGTPWPHGTVRFIGSNSTPTTTLALTSDEGIITVGEWHHVLISFNKRAGSAHMYVDDVEVKASENFYTATDTIDGTNASWRMLALANINLDLAEVFVDPYRYVDFSVEANRREFITSDLKPVDLGTDGNWPLGMSPYVYLSGGASAFFDNLGEGPAFSAAGVTPAMTDSTTSPSD